MKKTIPLLILMFVLVMPLASSFGPHTHNFVVNQLKEQAPEGSFLKSCLDGSINEVAFRSGAFVSDITVVYYFSSGGKKL